MSCPFAKYASYSKSSTPSNHHHNNHHGSSKPSNPSPSVIDSSSTLSQQLKEGTSVAHKAVERSPGVRAVLAMGNHSDANGWNMDRLDYIRWQVILTCVYAAMELPTLTHQARYLQQFSEESTSSSSSSSNQIKFDYSNSIVKPLLSTLISPASNLNFKTSSSSLPSTTSSTSNSNKPIPLLLALARTPSLLRDIESHLEALKEESGGLELSDFLAAKEDDDEEISSTSKDRDELKIEMKKILKSLSLTFKKLLSEEEQLNLDQSQMIQNFDLLISLVTTEQVKSTLNYVSRLIEIQRGIGNDFDSDFNGEEESQREEWLLSHCYVRYLGDLSGGQHISKRVKNRWPVSINAISTSSSAAAFPLEKDSEIGFEFYDFKSLGSSQSIKKLFKDGLNNGFDLTSSNDDVDGKKKLESLNSILNEASLSFDLNRKLFDSLVPEDLKSSQEQSQESDQIKDDGLDSSSSSNSKERKKLPTNFFSLKTMMPCPLTLLRSLGIQIPISSQTENNLKVKSNQKQNENQMEILKKNQKKLIFQNFNHGLLISFLILFLSFTLLSSTSRDDDLVDSHFNLITHDDFNSSIVISNLKSNPILNF